jgi:hypothetical protein
MDELGIHVGEGGRLGEIVAARRWSQACHVRSSVVVAETQQVSTASETSPITGGAGTWGSSVFVLPGRLRRAPMKPTTSAWPRWRG